MHRTTSGLTFALAVLLAGCGGGGGGDAAPVNSSPVAHAGTNQTVLELSNVTLSGTGSVDSDGSIQAYQWTQQGGPAVVLSNADTAAATFPAPDVGGPEELVFQLTVTDDDGAAASASVTVTVVENLTTTVSGKVTFDYVPVVSSPVCAPSSVCLDYLASEPRPARGVTVQLMEGATVADTAVTDENGDYSLTAAGGTDVSVRVRAEMVGSAPDWDVRVVDNIQGNALYVMDGTPFNASTAAVTVDLHADSGWTETGYGEPRVAAPFAVLDIVYDAMQLVLDADPAASFPPLVMHWSPGNTDTFGAGGQPDPATGEIGTSFYISGGAIPAGIYLLGDENNDTEEYDRHVIAHEWGHYFENSFSRSDSIGGPHTLNDQLDMRVAFGEGFGNAISGMITGDAVYKDTSGVLQGSGFSFSLESHATSPRGWYNEFSVQEILYDLYDATPGEDPVALGFGPLYEVLVNDQRETIALTSLFPFIHALKTDPELTVNPALIDTLAAGQSIATISDEYGSNRTNPAPPNDADVLPIYSSLTVNGGPVNVCSTDDFRSNATGSTNKLGSRRYLTFTADTTAAYTFTATTTEVEPDVSPDATPDPDMWLHRAGPRAVFQTGPDASCTSATLSSCREVASTTAYPQFFPGGLLPAGEYVLEVYEWTNTNTNDNDEPNPPIGRTCFDVEVTSP